MPRVQFFGVEGKINFCRFSDMQINKMAPCLPKSGAVFFVDVCVLCVKNVQQYIVIYGLRIRKVGAFETSKKLE